MTTNPAFPKGPPQSPPPPPRVAGPGVAPDGSPRTVPPPLPVHVHRKVNIYAGPARPEETEAPEPPTVRSSRLVRRAARTGKFAMYTGVPVLMLCLIAIGVLYVRLRHGPISFDSVVPPIENGINAELASYKVDIDGAELRLGDNGALEFRLRDIKVKEEAGGDIVAAAPLAAVNISTAALWRLRVVPSRVELIDPVINLVYTEASGFALDVTANAESVSGKVGGRLGSAAPAKEEVPDTARPVTEVPEGRHINLAKLLSDSSRRARKRLDATSYLTEFAMSNTTVSLNYQGQRSAWKVPEASVDFNHAKRRSVISARATVASARGPWSLTVLTDETERTGKLQVKTSIRDLVPAALSGAAPPLALLKTINAPVSGDATIDLSTEGEIEASDVALEIGTGQLAHADLPRPVELTAALLHLNYDGAERTWQLKPSPVRWRDGSLEFSGSAKDVSEPGAPPNWAFALDGNHASFESTEFNVPAVPLDVLYARGTIMPRRGLVDIPEIHARGGGGEVAVTVRVETGAEMPSTQVDATISAMPIKSVKALWPRALAPGAREWVGERLTAASFKGGKVKYRSGKFVTVPNKPEPGKNVEQLDGNFEVSDISFIPLPGMSEITAPRALVQIASNNLDITVPDAAFQLPGNRTIPLRSGRMASNDLMYKRTLGEISFSSAAPLGPFLEAVEQVPVRAVREASPLPRAGEGKVDAQMTIKLPLVSNINADDVAIEGKAKITDGKFGKAGGQFDVQGFTLDLDLSGAALEAKGHLLVNGVPADITGQRVFATAIDQQPPLKITAKLDDADRTQLGLDINDLVSGVVPVEISFQKNGRPEPAVHLKATLTGAELSIEPVAWRKAAGRPATLETDIVAGKQYKTELQNFKITGDDIAAEGWVGIGPDNRMREFHFPAFSLNVVSRLEVQGTLGPDNIWNVKALGPTFDGHDVLKSLLSVGDGPEKKAKPAKSSAGTDLLVEVNNVIGGYDVSMRGFKMKLSSRAEKLSSFEARGTLDGGAPVAALLDPSNGQRILKIDCADAGQLMKLMDFYPNMQNGRLRLEVNLDGKGPAEKTGKLWIDKFRVLGDPIVSEVVGSADQGRPAISGKTAKREVFEFNDMQARFSAGYGQFVIEASRLNGPAMGGGLRGKVDFKTRKINLGGTYIPLQGLNGAFGGIPLLGQLLSGANGEGIFGITFAVQGALSNPQVLVNPLSLLTPGILRGIMEMTPYDPQIQAREERAPAKPVEQRTRASSVPATATGSVSAPAPPAVKKAPKPAAPPPVIPQSNAVDGWSSTTNP